MMFGKYVVVFFIGLVGVQGQSFPGYTYYPDLNGWLKLHREAVDWQDARIKCHTEEALLAADWNPKMRSVINKLQAAEDQSFSVLHVGANVSLEIDHKGMYLYKDGEPTLSNSPGGFTRSEPCAGFLANGNIGEVDCNQKLPYVCFAITSACGNQSLGYTFFNGTKHCYKLHKTVLNWTEAYKACKQEGAYLAVANSDDELSYMVQLKNQSSEFFNTAIGIYYWTFSKSWLTVTGQTFEQAGLKWHKPEPTSEYEPYTAYRFGYMDQNGLIISQTQNYATSFICEKNIYYWDMKSVNQ